MRLAYEARVAVRGELASPKSFSRLIHNNKDDRDKRETHPRTLSHVGTKKPLSQHYKLRISFLQRLKPFIVLLNVKKFPIYFSQKVFL